jgi:hypothetical protein
VAFLFGDGVPRPKPFGAPDLINVRFLYIIHGPAAKSRAMGERGMATPKYIEIISTHKKVLSQNTYSTRIPD